MYIHIYIYTYISIYLSLYIYIQIYIFIIYIYLEEQEVVLDRLEASHLLRGLLAGERDDEAALLGRGRGFGQAEKRGGGGG